MTCRRDCPWLWTYMFQMPDVMTLNPENSVKSEEWVNLGEGEGGG